MYRLNIQEELTPEYITRYIEKDRTEQARKIRLKNYYLGKTAITKRVLEDSKPNNKVVNPYPLYITTLSTGYFMGEAVLYTGEDDELLAEIDAIYNYNDEASNNAELAKNASIYGSAYEIMYLDGEKNIRFLAISPEGCIPILEDTIEEPLLYFIRYYDVEDILTNNVKTVIEVYSRVDIKRYERTVGSMRLIDAVSHNWGMVPVNMYLNNEELQGDFELVIPLIDAFDLLESDTINENEYLSDCYLALFGVEGTDADDIAQMKQNRVLSLPAGAKAEWLVKNTSSATIGESEKTRLDASIHKFSFCPAMTDENFSGNSSGVALKYKLLGLEDATAKKERLFKKGLQRRLEIICNMLGLLGSAYDYRAINIVFNRNLPTNISEMADIVQKLGDLYSEKTRMAMMPVDVDYDAEQEQKKVERESEYDMDWSISNEGLLEQTTNEG